MHQVPKNLRLYDSREASASLIQQLIRWIKQKSVPVKANICSFLMYDKL